VIALVVLGLLLRRYGLPDNLTLGRRPSPEHGARHLLAERMAKGEVSTEEFMERASVLNWTPGSDVHPPRTRIWRRR
jgi:putative membrane protein